MNRRAKRNLVVLNARFAALLALDEGRVGAAGERHARLVDHRALYLCALALHLRRRHLLFSTISFILSSFHLLGFSSSMLCSFITRFSHVDMSTIQKLLLNFQSF